jgi:hypothetical protein
VELNGSIKRQPIKDFHLRSKDGIYMVDIRVKWRLASTLPILALSVILPACRSTGAPPPPLVRSPEASTRRFALRPILEGEGYRPYYVAGYAGASYGPGLFSRRSQVGLPTAPGPSIPNVTVEQGTWDPR